VWREDAPMGRTDALPTDLELPMYTDRPAPPVPVPHAPGAFARAAHTVATWVEDAIDGDSPEFSAPTTLDTRPPRDNLLVVHRLLGNPDRLLVEFTHFWGRTGGRLRSPLGTLRAVRVDAAEAGPMALLRGQVRLHTSFVPIPVELEIERWGTVGLVVFLRPVRHLVAHIGPHRRWAWFVVGHSVLEQIRRAIEQPRASLGPSGVAGSAGSAGSVGASGSAG
jgi:hypothetical protein